MWVVLLEVRGTPEHAYISGSETIIMLYCSGNNILLVNPLCGSSTKFSC